MGLILNFLKSFRVFYIQYNAPFLVNNSISSDKSVYSYNHHHNLGLKNSNTRRNSLIVPWHPALGKCWPILHPWSSPFLGVSYKQTQMVCSLWIWFLSFIILHLRSNTNEPVLFHVSTALFFLFQSDIPVMDIPQFIYSLTTEGLGLFLLSSNVRMNKVPINIQVWVFVWT